MLTSIVIEHLSIRKPDEGASDVRSPSPVAIGLVAPSGQLRFSNASGDEIHATGRSLVIYVASSGRLTLLPLTRLVSSEMFPPIGAGTSKETRSKDGESILNVRFEDHVLQLSFSDVSSAVNFMRSSGLV